MDPRIKIINITHPCYLQELQQWAKWRLTYEGGPRFVERYLKMFSKRETSQDFADRKEITPCPRFSGAALDNIKNSVFQRMASITRVGGSKSYQAACNALNGGVDRIGNSMNGFIGTKVLPELITMRKVGVYVDMPFLLPTATLNDQYGKQPYVYHYCAEDMLSWACGDPNEYTSILLRERVIAVDTEYGLSSGEYDRFRFVWKDPVTGYVNVRFYNTESEIINSYGIRVDQETGTIRLNIKRVPFAVMELSHSLMTDIAEYQIALLNLLSADLLYALKSNFPFYTEQTDVRHNAWSRQEGSDGTAEGAAAASNAEVKVGVTAGRAYGKGLERPGFINPSADPLRVSMELQAQLKADIHHLLNLTITNLKPVRASAESKQEDKAGTVENGLAYIGHELEFGERRIAEYWNMYENTGGIATINYPTQYSLISDAERRQEAKDTSELVTSVPSLTYKKELCKRIASIMLGDRVSVDVLNKVYAEIDKLNAINTDAKDVASDIINGIVSLEDASQARGWPKGSVEAAKEDHADRLKRIAESQSENALPNGGARGIPDNSPNPGADGAAEKKNSKDTTKDKVPTNKQRGEGK